MRLPLVPMALAALAGLMLATAEGTLQGALAGAREAWQAPAVLGFVALLLLRDRLAGFGPAIGWMLLGAAVAVALRGAAEGLGPYAWWPGWMTPTIERASEVGWCFILVLMAWQGVAWRWAGPLLAACVATTRVGGLGQALVPALFEPGLHEAVLLALGLVSGFAAAIAVLLVTGWSAFVVARMPGRWVRPGQVLAVMAAAAGIGHMLRL